MEMNKLCRESVDTGNVDVMHLIKKIVRHGKHGLEVDGASMSSIH
jgi:hypothetical protein